MSQLEGPKRVWQHTRAWARRVTGPTSGLKSTAEGTNCILQKIVDRLHQTCCFRKKEVACCEREKREGVARWFAQWFVLYLHSGRRDATELETR